MNDKINRGQLVRTYIGEGLAPFKFEYKGYHGDSWKFERNMKGAVQTISIYPYRFDQSMITFELYTNVKNIPRGLKKVLLIGKNVHKTDIVMLIGIIIYLLFTVGVTGIYLSASHKLKVDLQYII